MPLTKLSTTIILNCALGYTFKCMYSQLTANKNNKERLGWGISVEIRFIRSRVGGINIDLNTPNNLIWDKSYTGTIGLLKIFFTQPKT